jgi:threonine dehydratase
MPNLNLSEAYKAKILLKREDLQLVRSYKIRGAYHKISSLSKEQLAKGIVCASAGNHAQGVAFACQRLQVKGTIFMPSPTPVQKLKQVKMFGIEQIETILTGDTFDDSYQEAMAFCRKHDLSFIHPFNDQQVIEGQGTVGLEILQDSSPIDYLFLPIGGGGLASGILTVFKQLSPDTRIIGVEPAGAPSMSRALDSFREEIRGKKVVCIVSGSNNDITRTEEIRERSLLYEGLKHYFILRFPQRSGALREFLNEVLGPGDDITHFEYRKKHNRERGPAVVGLELKDKADLQGLLNRMDQEKIAYQYLNDQPDLFQYLVL